MNTILVLTLSSLAILLLPKSGPAARAKGATCEASEKTSCKVRSWDIESNEGKIHISGEIQQSFQIHIRPVDAAPYSLPVEFSSPESVRDCTATLECPNGTLLECAASGPRTSCSNNTTTVGCFVLDEGGDSVSGSSATCG